MANEKQEWTYEELLAENAKKEAEMAELRKDNAAMADIMTRDEVQRFQDKLGNVTIVSSKRDKSGNVTASGIMKADEVIGVLKNNSDKLQVLEGIPTGLLDRRYELNEVDYVIIGPGETHPVTRGMEVSGTPRKTGPNGCVRFEDLDPNDPSHKPAPKDTFFRANTDERGIDQSSGKFNLKDGKVIEGGVKAAFGDKPHVKDILPDQV